MTSTPRALRLLRIDATRAHTDGWVRYQEDGTARVTHPDLSSLGLAAELEVPPDRQFSMVRATFQDLSKALSRLANSPALEDGTTLRETFDAEWTRYEAAADAAWVEGRWEPDYGTYFLDCSRVELYLVAPERWHRLALVTSNAMLLGDPERVLTWQQVRHRLESAVVGFAGSSVGSAILGGFLREARPARVKLADPDWVELTNLNRMERMGLRHTCASRADRFDPRNPHDLPRVPKAEAVAHELSLVDPYLRVDVYAEGIDRSNLDRFLLGDGADEPGIEVLVEEMDDLELKIAVRERCRELGIDVVMATDFGHRVHVLWNYFRSDPTSPLGAGATDEELRRCLAELRGAGRARFFGFVDALCGADLAGPDFEAWFAGRGEQPTASIPQSGGTTMAAGGIVGKEIALHLLGHHAPPAKRVVVYDLQGRTAWTP